MEYAQDISAADWTFLSCSHNIARMSQVTAMSARDEDAETTPAPLTYYWNTSNACDLDDCVARLRREVSLPDSSVRCIGFDLRNVNLIVPHADILFRLKGLSCAALLFHGRLDLGPLEDVLERSTSLTTLALRYRPPPGLLARAGLYHHLIHHIKSKTSGFPMLDDVTTLFLRVDGYCLNITDVTDTILAFGSRRLLPRLSVVHIFDSPGELPEGVIRKWIKNLQQLIRTADKEGPRSLACISWGRWIIHREYHYCKREYTFERWEVQDEVNALTEAGLGGLWGPLLETMY
ncbi:uncharacterized protein TRAVEDRAFT_53671 [Trametes versicolor FP-101664 SS1]|uniref:uncharacterized protein n=1 Tax=Trametes versicolor (strain FP-101664) TaxID=717944 RepID=UPI00046247B6|nr:uncharacterized protein TRAVEDRAFT_53671 [Trametes versicolor FP-101664 SS1]EIW52245.1 hypothetical protein TRAVEDRAFT_53671 [Trametes versicolor FP-101664 SS1]